MKKDKKWLVDKWTKERNGIDVYDPMYQFISEFIADVNQLDEPEVLSQEWIDEHKWVAKDIKTGVTDYAVADYDLQNLLVPKQEEPNDDLYILMLNGGFVTGFELETGRVVGLERQSDYDASVVMGTRPFMEFIQKQVGGELHNITNPEEPKYRVEDSHEKTLLAKMKYSHNGKTFEEVEPYDELIAGYKKELTEQEIKDYDPRYFAFAKKVKELEE